MHDGIDTLEVACERLLVGDVHHHRQLMVSRILDLLQVQADDLCTRVRQFLAQVTTDQAGRTRDGDALHRLVISTGRSVPWNLR